MLMQYVRVTASELVTLRRLVVMDPDKAFDFADELADGGDPAAKIEDSRGIDTDKTWDAMARLLPLAGFTVDVVHGGERLTEDEWGYEPPRCLSPALVAEAAAAFERTPFERVAAHYDPATLADAYPPVWDDPDSMDYLRLWYERLSRFVRNAADDGDAIVVYLA